MKATAITIFTDGASRGNPGPGGWGAIIIENGIKKENGLVKVRELGGSEQNTTNNRMELKAAIEGLSKTPKKAEIVLYTDSSYLINGITKWVKQWKKIDWITRTKEEVLNKDLWLELDALALERNVAWKYVGGHAGVKGNERCDEIATTFADGKKIKLFEGNIGEYNFPDILNVDVSETKIETKSRRKAVAYSYISSVGGVIEVHHSWPECEKRVKGVRDARYKKSLNAEDQERIIAEFSAV